MDVDKILEEKAKEIKMPDNINLKIDNLLKNEETNTKANKQYLKIAACLIVILVFSVGAILTCINISQNNKVVKDNVSQLANGKQIYTYVTDEMKKDSKYIDENKATAQISKAYTPKDLLELCDCVVLITVESIEGASREYSSSTMTYGKVIVNNVILGDIKLGDEIEYLKPGGYITVAEYDKYEDGAEVTEEQTGEETQYYNTLLNGDIEIEVGKTYLAYLHYDNNEDKYEIIGLGNGLREINIPKENVVTSKEYDLDELKILNNTTNEWESLKEYIENNI